MLHFIGLKALAAALGLALLEGGRRERMVALVLSIETTLFWFTATWQGPSDVVTICILCMLLQAGALLPLCLMAAAFRARWLWVLCALQAVVAVLWVAAAVDPDHFDPQLRTPLEWLDVGKAACLALALAGRWLMPPAPVPGEKP